MPWIIKLPLPSEVRKLRIAADRVLTLNAVYKLFIYREVYELQLYSPSFTNSCKLQIDLLN